jgi:hypothetical protein
MEEVTHMQRATTSGYRIRIFAAAFVAAIATTFIAPSIGASTQSTNGVARFVCPPMC